MRRHIITALASTVVAVGCSIGGIVDNGDKENPPATPGSGHASVVLAGYEVTLPDGWRLHVGLSPDEVEADSTTGTLTLVRGRINCVGKQRTNVRGVVIITCDLTRSLLLPTPEDPIIATAAPRTPTTEAILESFGPKTP